MSDEEVLRAITEALQSLNTTREYLADGYPVKADREICSALLRLNVIKNNLQKRGISTHD